MRPPHGAALELDAVGVVEQAVANGVGLVGVADDGVPVRDGQLAGDEGRGAFGAVLDDLGEVAPLGVAKRREMLLHRRHRPRVRPDSGGSGRIRDSWHRSCRAQCWGLTTLAAGTKEAGVTEVYGWAFWFRELAVKIAEGGEEWLIRQARLVDWDKEPELLKHGDQGVDPFSFLYSLAQRNTTNQRPKIYPSVTKCFGLESPLADLGNEDFYIFPTPPPNGCRLLQRQQQLQPEAGCGCCSGRWSSTSRKSIRPHFGKS